jgi:hypothetical protein
MADRRFVPMNLDSFDTFGNVVKESRTSELEIRLDF